jgi:hypothetical protein
LRRRYPAHAGSISDVVTSSCQTGCVMRREEARVSFGALDRLWGSTSTLTRSLNTDIFRIASFLMAIAYRLPAARSI